MKRNRYTMEFTTKVALEATKGQKTANELASEFGVHVSQINTWKKQPGRRGQVLQSSNYRLNLKT